MLLKNNAIGREALLLRSAVCKRTLTVIACASILAGCESVPSFSEMGDGISQTYSEMETGVRQKYNETFSSDEQSSENEMASADGMAERKYSKASFSRSEVKRLQRRLAELAFRPGPADGVMGARTVRAIRRYQAAHRLPVTGKMSSQLLTHVEEAYASAKAEQMLTNSPN